MTWEAGQRHDGPGGIVTEDFASDPEKSCGGPPGSDSEWTTTVVPEPVTTTLMTIGVAGWAAAHARRRRQDGLELEEDDERLG